MGIVYIISNYCNDKKYIGQTTKTLNERFSQHKKDARNKNHNKCKLYIAFNEIGIDKFYCEVLEDNVPDEKLIEKEMHYIEVFDSCNNGYNTRKGGKGGRVFSFNEIETIKEKAQRGINAIDIAKEYGVHVETVYRTLHEFGYRYYNTNDEKIKKEFNSGKSIKEIAESCNVHRRTVERHLKKMNLSKAI